MQEHKRFMFPWNKNGMTNNELSMTRRILKTYSRFNPVSTYVPSSRLCPKYPGINDGLNIRQSQLNDKTLVVDVFDNSFDRLAMEVRSPTDSPSNKSSEGSNDVFKKPKLVRKTIGRDRLKNKIVAKRKVFINDLLFDEDEGTKKRLNDGSGSESVNLALESKVKNVKMRARRLKSRNAKGSPIDEVDPRTKSCSVPLDRCMSSSEQNQEGTAQNTNDANHSLLDPKDKWEITDITGNFKEISVLDRLVKENTLSTSTPREQKLRSIINMQSISPIISEKRKKSYAASNLRFKVVDKNRPLKDRNTIKEPDISSHSPITSENFMTNQSNLVNSTSNDNSKRISKRLSINLEPSTQGSDEKENFLDPNSATQVGTNVQLTKATSPCTWNKTHNVNDTNSPLLFDDTRDSQKNSVIGKEKSKVAQELNFDETQNENKTKHFGALQNESSYYPHDWTNEYNSSIENFDVEASEKKKLEDNNHTKLVGHPFEINSLVSLSKDTSQMNIENKNVGNITGQEDTLLADNKEISIQRKKTEVNNVRNIFYENNAIDDDLELNYVNKSKDATGGNIDKTDHPNSINQCISMVKDNRTGKENTSKRKKPSQEVTEHTSEINEESESKLSSRRYSIMRKTENLVRVSKRLKLQSTDTAQKGGKDDDAEYGIRKKSCKTRSSSGTSNEKELRVVISRVGKQKKSSTSSVRISAEDNKSKKKSKGKADNVSTMDSSAVTGRKKRKIAEINEDSGPKESKEIVPKSKSKTKGKKAKSVKKVKRSEISLEAEESDNANEKETRNKKRKGDILPRGKAKQEEANENEATNESLRARISKFSDPSMVTKRRKQKSRDKFLAVIEEDGVNLNNEEAEREITKRLTENSARMSEGTVSNRQSQGIFLMPGKSWARSLSIINNFYGGQNLDELSAGRGKNWRHSVETVLNMQYEGLVNVTNNRSKRKPIGKRRMSHLEPFVYDAECESERMSLQTVPCQSSNRFSIRIIPNSNKSLLEHELFQPDIVNPNGGEEMWNMEIPRCPAMATRRSSLIQTESDLIRLAQNIVLKRCKQSSYLPFDDCFPDWYIQRCRKIGEGVYGEVFLYDYENEKSVIKIIPIEGSQLVNNEPQKKFHEILSEIIIAEELHKLRFGMKYNTDAFVGVNKIMCVKGKYPEKLLDLWNYYDEEKNSENDSPAMFGDEQLYIILVLAHGGQDLEAYAFHNACESLAIFLQTAYSLAIAEHTLEFEHRDLHWGNLLISKTTEKKAIFRLKNELISVPTKGSKVCVIDFTLSRMSYKGCRIFNDLAVDHALFEAQGEYQFEVYRLMRETLKNDWQRFNPYTNLLWLDYLLEKMISSVKYNKKTSKIHKIIINHMRILRKQILNYDSAYHFVTKHPKLFYLCALVSIS